MLLSRFTRNKKKEASKDATGTAATGTSSGTKDKRKMPELTQYLDERDYAGAISLLSFQKQTDKADKLNVPLWIAYCGFHAGDYEFASDQYELLLKQADCPPEVNTYLACCFFYRGLHEEAKAFAETAAKSPLNNRLMFHITHKLGDEKALMHHHAQLQDVLEDNLCLASIHYLRGHYQEAIDIYKRLLLSNRNFIALNVYLALCYYKLDYYDVSLEVLQVYLQQHPDSATAVNMRACNHYKLYSGKSAEAEIRVLDEQATPAFKFARDLIEHNLVVFRSGDKALQVLPPLLDVLPEARLNLVIYHLKNGDIDAAYSLMDDLEPTQTNETILKAVVHCLIGQQDAVKAHLKSAQELFHTIGSSQQECDTIPGRQCMASALFLQQQFQDVLVYLNSIKTYFYNDDTFNYNFGQALMHAGRYAEAEEALLLVQDNDLVNDETYLMCLARSYIMNRKARQAWEMCVGVEREVDNHALLQLIANDCYKMGAFYYAAKAFDLLERTDSNPEFWEGKRGACIGTFQMVLAGYSSNQFDFCFMQRNEQITTALVDTLRDVLAMIQTTSHPQVEQITRIIRKWTKENKVNI